MSNEGRKNGAYWAGMGLIGLGVVDAVANPFGFITAPKLLAAGGSMVAMSIGISTKKGDSDEN